MKKARIKKVCQQCEVTFSVSPWRKRVKYCSSHCATLSQTKTKKRVLIAKYRNLGISAVDIAREFGTSKWAVCSMFQLHTGEKFGKFRKGLVKEENRKLTRTTFCNQCGKPFTAKGTNIRFCSRHCTHKHHARASMVRYCWLCKKRYHPFRNRPFYVESKKVHKDHAFCSQKCYLRWKKLIADLKREALMMVVKRAWKERTKK